MHFMYDVSEEKGTQTAGQDCSTIFRRASKPLTKSELESAVSHVTWRELWRRMCARPAYTHARAKRLHRAAPRRANKKTLRAGSFVFAGILRVRQELSK